MSTKASACTSARVSSKSDSLGAGDPDGWLWASMTAAALRAKASLTTSRG